MFEDFDVQRKDLPVSVLENNRGQVYGLPKNPRYIKDERFAKLVKSIEDDPEFMKLNELKVWLMDNGNYIILSGNMRYRACTQLGWETIPCVIVPKETPVAKLRSIVIKENEMFGNNDWDLLANEWEVEELKGFGMEVDFIQPTEETDLDSFFEEVEDGDAKKEKNIDIKVSIPQEEADLEDEVREILKEALKDYPNISVK